MFRRAVAFAIFALFSVGVYVSAPKSHSPSQCDVPSYFGICDPYVPGTIIALKGKQPIRVIQTWHDGPAERAGVCPGDKIVAVNGVLASENTSNRMLREIVSASPTSVRLTILRGKQTLEFQVPRARESTLARLSHQRFMLIPEFNGIEALVPLGETRREFAQYVAFVKRMEGADGFTRIEGLRVPKGTPPAQVEKLKPFLSHGPTPERLAGFVPPSAGKYSLGLGFIALKDPTEVFIHTVLPYSPANRTGLFPGDRLLEVNDHDVSKMSFDDLKTALLKPDEAREVNLKVEQSGEERSLKMRNEKYSTITENDFEVPLGGHFPTGSPDYYLFGFQVLYAATPRGAVVSEVDWPSPAFDVGLRVGDSILSVGGKPIAEISRDDMTRVLTPKSAAPITIEMSRLGKAKVIHMTPATYRTILASMGRKWTSDGPMPEGCVAD
jgi:C-terminal processing protease CtpA/Prc